MVLNHLRRRERPGNKANAIVTGLNICSIYTALHQPKNSWHSYLILTHFVTDEALGTFYY